MSRRAKYYSEQARLYFESAKAADHKIGHLPGYDTIAPAPVMMMCAHAIELSFKAFLLENGVDENTVKALNHKLCKAHAKCLEVASQFSLTLPDLDQQVLNCISDLHESMSLKYGNKSKSGRAPVFGPLSTLTEKCMEMCRAPQIWELEA